MNLISKKKIVYPISVRLRNYLKKYGRVNLIPLTYADLLRYSDSISTYDRNGKDTLWVSVYFEERLQIEIHEALKLCYAHLKSGGELNVLKHLYVDRIDMCTYGNTLPFRIRIVNKLNDNFDYFYIKKADASRVYGLELEHLLSPNRIAFFIDNDLLVEEHIAGIPADQFLQGHFLDRHFDEIRVAKEFVKFNERCFVRLLGDMHSSNFVVDITPDFEETHYRMCALDFDQQSFEGNKKVYMPQFFKQNLMFVKLVSKNLTKESVLQYQKEEHALINRRVRSSRYQVKDLLDAMMHDELSTKEKIENLKKELAKHYKNEIFLTAKTMGHLVKLSIKLIVGNLSGFNEK